MKKCLLALPVVLLILAVTAFGVFADTDTDNPTASVVISGGSLSVTTAAIDLGTLTLNGTDQSVTSSSNDWEVKDATGTGLGWTATIESSDFLAGTHEIDITLTDSQFTILLEQEDGVTVDAGNTEPVSQATTAKVIPHESANNPYAFLSASAGTGMGTYSLHPVFTLAIPAYTYAGDYSATVTVTVSNGP